MRRGAQRHEEDVQPWYIIDPDSYFWRAWNLLQALSIMYLVVSTPSEQLRRCLEHELRHAARASTTRPPPDSTLRALTRQLVVLHACSLCCVVLAQISAYLFQKSRHG